MNLTRRGFLKLTGATAAAATMTGVGLQKATAAYEPVRLNYAREVPTICTFCGVGCGIICHVQDGVIVNTEGDPDHPINQGTLCPKGISHYNLSYVYDSQGRPQPNPKRLTKPLRRKPGATDWEEIEWDEALEQIAKKFKETRDESFIEQEQGVTVNRTDAISWLGSAFVTNEENYLFHKIIRSTGIVNMDHCARL